MKKARLEGPFTAGSKLTDGGLVKHRLQIAKVVDEELVLLYGTMLGYKGITQWNIRSTAEHRTEVTFTESSADFLLGTLYSNKSLGLHLQI